jgi:hypothetical protein
VVEKVLSDPARLKDSGAEPASFCSGGLEKKRPPARPEKRFLAGAKREGLGAEPKGWADRAEKFLMKANCACLICICRSSGAAGPLLRFRSKSPRWGSLNSLRAPGKRSSRAKPGETGPISRAAARKRERGFLKATGPGRRCESWRMERFLCGASSVKRQAQYTT